MNSFDEIGNHPGLMTYSNGRIELLHANWPAYPSGRGWSLALASLAVFPRGVRFRKIDYIDQCVLLVAEGSGSCLQPKDNLFDTRWFHVAIFREDLLELIDRELVAGARHLSAFEAAREYFEKHKVLELETDEGVKRIELPEPDPADYEDNYLQEIEIDDAGLVVTKLGLEALQSIAPPVTSLDAKIRERALPLLTIGQYDTAVREASVILETTLRELTLSEHFGQVLAEEFFKIAVNQSGRTSAYLKVARAELRTLFKFVRNDFAHCLREISEGQCRALLARISESLQRVVDSGVVPGAPAAPRNLTDEWIARNKSRQLNPDQLIAWLRAEAPGADQAGAENPIADGVSLGETERDHLGRAACCDEESADKEGTQPSVSSIKEEAP